MIKLNVKVIFILFLSSLFSACSVHNNQSKSSTSKTSNAGEILSINGQLKISGIYLHLTTYSHGRVSGNYGYGNECGC